MRSFTVSEPQPHSYNEMNKIVGEVASGLRAVGLGKDGWRDEDGKERVTVYADTSMNWQIISHTLARMGHTLSTAYTTLGPEGLQHSLDEPSARMVFTNGTLLKTLNKVIDDCPTLRWVVYDKESETDQALVKEIADKLAKRAVGDAPNAEKGRILSLTEVRKLGQQSPVPDEEWRSTAPKPDDLYCIMVSLSGSVSLLGYLTKSHKTSFAVHVWLHWHAQGCLVDTQKHHLFLQVQRNSMMHILGSLLTFRYHSGRNQDFARSRI